MDSDADDPLKRLEEERGGGARLEFQEQLDESNARLVEAARMVADNVLPVTMAFLEADNHAAEEFLAVEVQLRERCRELQEHGYLLLARQSPVAVDLRRVVATLLSAGDIERSGNLLAHVAESLAWVHPPALPADLRTTVRQLGERSAEVFARGVAAWETHDPLAAVELNDLDDEVDMLQKVLLTEIYTGRRSVEEAVTLALLARYYERIADHGVELARQVTYFVTGERVLTDRDDEDDL